MHFGLLQSITDLPGNLRNSTSDGQPEPIQTYGYGSCKFVRLCPRNSKNPNRSSEKLYECYAAKIEHPCRKLSPPKLADGLHPGRVNSGRPGAILRVRAVLCVFSSGHEPPAGGL